MTKMVNLGLMRVLFILTLIASVSLRMDDKCNIINNQYRG